jgi:peroxiredoxin Q/BCP
MRRSSAESYGVVALGGLYARRWTFYIDPSGRVRHVGKNVDVATAGQDIARILEELDFPRAE